MQENENGMVKEYLDFLSRKDFACVAAREAVSRQQVKCFVAGHMGCPHDDSAILDFLYDFIQTYRNQKNRYHSAAILFAPTVVRDENMFDTLMWQRLQALSDADATKYPYDSRVAAQPESEDFSFSLMEEALFIIGLHPLSSRPSRRFKYATLVFNPHEQFQQMKESTQYDKMKNIVRKRDMAYSGSINPMLDDFGNSSEVYQYSGKQYSNEWECPLKISHAGS